MQSTNHFKGPKHKGLDSNGRNLVHKISEEVNFNNEVKWCFVMVEGTVSKLMLNCQIKIPKVVSWSMHWNESNGNQTYALNEVINI